MQFVYPAIFHKEEEGYWTEFPDLKGCYSQGDSIPETLANAQEALTGFLIILLEDKKTLPLPSDISDISAADGFTTLVSCNLDAYKDTKSVKKTLTIPEWLDERATRMGINFSQTLQEALINKIQS